MSIIILTVEVEIENNGVRTHRLAADFESRVNDLLEEGGITGETEAEVKRRLINVHWTE